MAVDHCVSFAGVGTRSVSSDQRPSADGGATRRLLNDPDAGRSRLRVRRTGALVNARSAWNVSLVSTPFQTRSQSAATVSPGYPSPAASWSAPKKDAPDLLSDATMACSRSERSSDAGG